MRNEPVKARTSRYAAEPVRWVDLHIGGSAVSAEQSIYIEAPVSRVFDWFKDPTHWLELNPAARQREEITDVVVTPGGLGTFHVWRMKPVPGVRFECFGVFTEFVPNKRIVDKWSLSLEGTETYLFDAEGTGTRVTLQRKRRSIWALRPLDMLVDHLEGPENEQLLVRLKQHLEATTGSNPAGGHTHATQPGP
jgi:uncharacterized protein YndB with AHSA1/START domain